jgi:DNA-binding response OmpR family regulator
MAIILVIDDDRRVRQMIRRVLSSAGHEVLEAENGQKGLALFTTRRPALVISDIIMPDQEGISTIRQVRKTCVDVPILAISGGGSFPAGTDYLRMAASLGADATLGKPFAADDLVYTVGVLLSLGTGH